MDVYFTRLKYFIALLEGFENEAYLDGIKDPDNKKRYISARKFYGFDKARQDALKDKRRKKDGKDPITTVGIGANINSKKDRKQYDDALGEPGLMQRVYYGKAKLTDEQVGIIFKDRLNRQLKTLKAIYGSSWDKLRANERMCIHSLYFNKPTLANSKSNLMKNIKKYIETNDEKFLRLAIKEVTERSNPAKVDGIQNRRNAEGALLASYESPAYTKPWESPDARQIEAANLNDTIMPLSSSKKRNTGGRNADYFIWRTKMDNKVRADHMLLEGKIFRKEGDLFPGSLNNCRCHTEEVPDHILIKDHVAESKAFTLYLRKGIIPIHLNLNRGGHGFSSGGLETAG